MRNNKETNIYIYVYVSCPSVPPCPSRCHRRPLSVRPSRRRPPSSARPSCRVRPVVVVVVLCPSVRPVVRPVVVVRPLSVRSVVVVRSLSVRPVVRLHYYLHDVV